MPQLRPYKVEVRDNASFRPDMTRRFARLKHADIHATRLRRNGLPAVITLPPKLQPIAPSGANIHISRAA